MAPSMESSKERVAFSRPSENFDFTFSDNEAELIDLAGPAGRFVAAARRRSKAVQPEVVKEAVPTEVQKKTPEKKSWADMMEEEDGFIWPEEPKKASDASFSTASGEKWSWSTAATDQDFDDLLEEMPEPLEIPKSKAEELEQAQQEEKRLAEEKMRKEQEIAAEKRLLQQLQQQEQLRQQQIEHLIKQQHLEQLRQQQLQQEHLRQQQLQQEQMRQQQLQQLQLQQNMQMQQFQQMQQLQQVPVLVAVPCMAVQVAPAATTAPEMPEVKVEEKKKEEVVLSGGPFFGNQHRFHQKNTSMGVLSPDARSFTKCSNKGRLSIVCENRVHFSGVVRYAVQFTEGELCSADGVGFILSSDLPCTKNIQKIVSVFANRTGRICVRVHEDVKRCQQRVKCLELGDWLEVISDLEQQQVTFVVWPKDGSAPTWATISFGDVLEKARGRTSVPRSPCGYLAVVMKHLGVSVNLAS